MTVFLKNNAFPKIFPGAWTQFRMEKKSGIAGLANGALYAEIREVLPDDVDLRRRGVFPLPDTPLLGTGPDLGCPDPL